MLKAAVNVNGRISDGETAVVPVFDHGFLYGEGVYETLRTYNRQPFLLEHHFDRLRASAAAIGLTIPLGDRGIHRPHRRPRPRPRRSPANATSGCL